MRETKTPWIDVRRELPESNSKDDFGNVCSELVLIRFEGNNYRVAYYFPDEKKWRIENDENGYEPFGHVTHWMKIPKIRFYKC
jgi:hypothetical protein